MKKSMFKRIFVPVIIFLLCLLLLGGSMMGIMPGSQSQNQISSSPDSQAEPETGSIDAEKTTVSVDLYHLDTDTQQKIGLIYDRLGSLCVALNGEESSFTFAPRKKRVFCWKLSQHCPMPPCSPFPEAG